MTYIDAVADMPGTREQDIARLIDHTLLRPDATIPEIEELCAEAIRYSFASVCVNPCHVSSCAGILRETGIPVSSVVSFPLGASTTAAKLREAEEVLRDGATELDIVANIGMLKSGNLHYVLSETRSLVGVAATAHAVTKIFIEAPLLTEAEKIASCMIMADAGADFVKTSTGFQGNRATAADVRLIMQTVGTRVRVKAAGGIRTFDDVQVMISSGASRIGTSAGVAIIRELDLAGGRQSA